MKLLNYINVFFQGNKSAFARAIGIQQSNLYPLIDRDAEVIGGVLYTGARVLPEIEGGWPAQDFHPAFEAMVKGKVEGKGITLNFERSENGAYLDPQLRQMFKGFMLGMEIAKAMPASKDAELSNTIINMEGQLRAIKAKVVEDNAPDDSYF